MRKALASIVLTVGVGFSGASHAADCSALRIKNTVKMEPIARSGLMVVPITLNGVAKKFLFDTGGTISSISEAAASELKLPEYHSRYRTSDLHGEASTSFVQIHDVRFGAGSTSGVQLQVMGDYGFQNGGAPFDGILVTTGLFSHDDIDLDFNGERVNFFSPEHCEGKVVYWPHQVLSVVPVKMEQGHIDVPVSLDGHPLRALLDTGSSRTVLNLSRAVEKLGFSPDVPAAPGIPRGNPDRQIYPRRFATLAFEGVTVANPLVVVRPMAFGPANELELGSRAENKDDILNRLTPDMIIGMDVLSHLHVYLAVNEQKLYVTEAGSGESVLFKNAPAGNPAPPAN
jgi:predicted aspartyl protease